MFGTKVKSKLVERIPRTICEAKHLLFFTGKFVSRLLIFFTVVVSTVWFVPKDVVNPHYKPPKKERKMKCNTGSSAVIVKVR